MEGREQEGGRVASRNAQRRGSSRGGGASNDEQKTKRRFTVVREANKLAWFVPGRSLAVALAGTAYSRGSGSQGTRWDRDATPRRAYGVTAGPSLTAESLEFRIGRNWRTGRTGSARGPRWVYGGRSFSLC